MLRTIGFVLALVLASAPAFAAPRLERVVLVMRHGVRPPTQTNDELAKYADRPWPSWPVAPGELTPHGGETVRLMGESLRAAYRSLSPAHGCAPAGAISVWADGQDQRTRKTGEILADALAPGCGVKAGWIQSDPRDPIFGGPPGGARDKAAAAMAAAAAGPAGALPLGDAVARLQAIMAPNACAGGPGVCFAKPSAGAAPGAMTGPFPAAAGLAEDILLEYADDKPMREVGWGRASAADIAAVMPIHERAFAIVGAARSLSTERGAPMARVVLAALAGEPASGGPQSGPTTKLLALAGHDTNLVLMASIFGLAWALPDQPDSTAPSTVLAFELWSDAGRRYVRPVLYYETLSQLRTLRPATAKRLPLSFKDCASGPLRSCPLDDLRRRAEAAAPSGD